MDSSTVMSLSTPSVSSIQPIRWQDDAVYLLDQTQLPTRADYLRINSAAAMAKAIQRMVVRGAPAIGVAAAYGVYLGAREFVSAQVALQRDEGLVRGEFLAELARTAELLKQTRPTAVNLFWAVDRMMAIANATVGEPLSIAAQLLEAAHQLLAEDIATCHAIGDYGFRVLPLQPQALRILTHCNTGSLATAGYGTALGVIRSAWGAGRLERVYADETRPRLQGAKLTAWECVQEGIPVTVITDNMAAHCMQQGRVDAVIVGADRITANGDTANKIGTYGLAIAAQAHGVPFYVAAPLSTVDFNLRDGSQIPIEERDPAEIYQVGEYRLVAEGAEFYNPAFDVTPARLITAIITEQGAVPPDQLIRLKP